MDQFYDVYSGIFTLYIPGDLNQDFTVNEDDAIYLLQYVLLPEYFPL